MLSKGKVESSKTETGESTLVETKSQSVHWENKNTAEYLPGVYRI